MPLHIHFHIHDTMSGISVFMTLKVEYCIVYKTGIFAFLCVCLFVCLSVLAKNWQRTDGSLVEVKTTSSLFIYLMKK